MATYYYVYPFGENADDLTTIPTSAAVDGSVSYYAGYTDPYEYDLLTNPSALPVERGSFNQLMFQATSNIQQYQQYGTPNWIASSDNLGSPYAYPIYARVYYGALVYENQVASNTATPGADSTWLVISGQTDSIQVGMTIEWNTIGSPTGRYLFCDGSAVSRTTYSGLYNVICPIIAGNTTNASDTITSLSDTTDLRIGAHVEGTGIPAGATIIAIPSINSVQISANATGTGTAVSIRFFLWGNGDGSTTFNVPLRSGYYVAGAGGSGIIWAGETYSGVGASLGNEDYEIALTDLPSHTHDKPFGTGFLIRGDSSSSDFNEGSTFMNTSDVTGDITGFTTQTSIPQIPPTKLVKIFIRY